MPNQYDQGRSVCRRRLKTDPLHARSTEGRRIQAAAGGCRKPEKSSCSFEKAVTLQQLPNVVGSKVIWHCSMPVPLQYNVATIV